MMEWPAVLCCMHLALLLALVVPPVSSMDVTDYLMARDELLTNETCRRLGVKMSLDNYEQMVSRFLLMLKQKAISAARMNESRYMPADSFYLSRKWMAGTPIFEIIRNMPKGAALHVHELALTSLDWLIANLTYRDNAFMCVGKHGYLKFAIFNKVPVKPDCEWKSVKTERVASRNPTVFNERLKRNLSLLTTDPIKTFTTPYEAWHRLQIYTDQVTNLIRRPTVLKDYLMQAVKEFMADKVQHVEVRARLTGMVDEVGNQVEPEAVLEMYEDVTEDAMRRFNNVLGLRVIQASPRYDFYEDVLKEVQMALKLRDDYATILLGFDLVGYENPNHPLIYYIEALLSPSRRDPPVKLPYFFHASETSWYGTDADLNLIDAVLLNVTRIGHAYSLIKYATTAKIIMERKIGLEINPISNQIKGLVKDLKNHAMIPLLNADAPIMISSDYPAAWEALPLSHDIYVTLMAMSPKDAGLRFLKQLALNSIIYSALNDQESNDLHRMWRDEWRKFITKTVDFYGLADDSFADIAENGDDCILERQAYSARAECLRTRPDSLFIFMSVCLSIALKSSTDMSMF